MQPHARVGPCQAFDVTSSCCKPRRDYVHQLSWTRGSCIGSFVGRTARCIAFSRPYQRLEAPSRPSSIAKLKHFRALLFSWRASAQASRETFCSTSGTIRMQGVRGAALLALLMALAEAAPAASQLLQPQQQQGAAPSAPTPAEEPAAVASPAPRNATAATAPSPRNATAATSAPPPRNTTGANATGAGRAVPDESPLPVRVVQTSPGWRLARSTYYGAPRAVSQAFDPTRGEGSFGILAYGACGYTNSDGTIPFPRDAVAAMADGTPDYAGSCGRCYAVRCKSGTVLDNDLQPLSLTAPNFTYLAGINSTVKDEFGRSWLGNRLEAQGQLETQCWNNDIHVVRITDSCPCRQVLPETAPGVAPGGEVRRQHWCCGGVQHLDLSYWLFEQMAHPLNGLMMLEYKPVQCPADLAAEDTEQSLQPLPFSPGFVDRTAIYDSRGTTAGWSWTPYAYKEAYWRLADAGPAPGQGATCLHLSPKGGISFRCRGCDAPGLQPLANVGALELTVRPNSNSSDPFFSSTPQDQVPPLKVYLLNEGSQKYCNAQLNIAQRRPSAVARAAGGGSWYTFRMPLSAFRCDYEGAFPAQITNVGIENDNEREAYVCIARLALLPASADTPDDADARGAGAAGGNGTTGTANITRAAAASPAPARSPVPERTSPAPAREPAVPAAETAASSPAVRASPAAAEEPPAATLATNDNATTVEDAPDGAAAAGQEEGVPARTAGEREPAAAAGV